MAAEQEKEQYAAKLRDMSEQELYKACRQMIWLSAYASNNPRSAYHWKVSACYKECERREKPEIYSKAYKDAEREVIG